MPSDLDYLAPRVAQILREPGTDLSTISAKRVRRQLVELDSSITADFLKQRKAEVDDIISRVFAQVSAEKEGVNGGRTDEDEEEEEEEKAARPPKKKAKKNGKEITDEELARKLSNEINARTTRTSGKSSGKARSAKGRSKKSSATVNSDGESDSGGENRSRKSGGAKGGFKKEFVLSQPLAAVLDVEKLTRPQVVKQLWVYIKGNELQNPSNKREILCDSKLRAVFNVDKIDMFAMNKVLGKHLLEDES